MINRLIGYIQRLLIRKQALGFQCERCGKQLFAESHESLLWIAEAHTCDKDGMVA